MCSSEFQNEIIKFSKMKISLFSNRKVMEVPLTVSAENAIEHLVEFNLFCGGD